MGKSNKGKSNKSGGNRARQNGASWKTSKNKSPVAIVVKDEYGYGLKPCEKARSRYIYDLAGDLNGAKPGDVVAVEEAFANNRQKFKITKVLGHETDPGIQTKISIHEYGLRQHFSQAAKQQAANMNIPALGQREDIRHIPLVTIDPVNARDFDDAVYAEPTEDGGHHIIVAIADVAAYVKPGSDLDKEALARGNSTYFPDKVIPMLPEALSNDLCSLRPNEDRACMGFHMWINKDGELTRYRPFRGLMNSSARLTYQQVQEARDGNPDDTTKPLMDTVINPLYDAYEKLAQARERRGTLSFDKPEQEIIANDNGIVVKIEPRERIDSQRLIEEFMILANVSAAKALKDKGFPCIYRVHESPSPKKIKKLKDILEAAGIPANDLGTASGFKKMLDKAKGRPDYEIISTAALRATSKARYTTQNYGHFGLALDEYAHFTSPIRRSADLFVHRALISAYNLGNGGLEAAQKQNAEDVADKITGSEIKSIQAERAARGRLTAAFHEADIGKSFDGRIQQINQAGIFVQLDDTGANGLIPLSVLSKSEKDYFDYDKDDRTLKGQKTGKMFKIGDSIAVRLKHADGLSGSIIFETDKTRMPLPRTGTSPDPSP